MCVDVDASRSASVTLPAETIQEPFLSDLSPSDKPWDVHRAQADQVAEILSNGNTGHRRQAERMRQCAQVLDFGWTTELSTTGETRLKLKKTHFCRVRSCPVCQWRRSLMWVSRFYHAFPNVYRDHPDLRYALLTLTVKNCAVAELRQTIKAMNSAWQRMTQRKAWPAVGFVRSLEVTRGKDGSAHPHYHVLLALEPSYFGRNYLSAAKWSRMWQEALRADYTPIVDVRLVKPKPWAIRKTSPLGEEEVKLDEIRTEIVNMLDHDPFHDTLQPTKVEVLISAITEVIKYAVKPSDMTADPDWLLTVVDQLRNSRAVAVGGLLREYMQEEEPEDLVHGEAEEPQENPGGVLFGWREKHERYQREKSRKNG